MFRRVFIGACAIAAIALPAAAEDWPTKQIKVVIAYPPGGPTDISSRIVMEKVGRILGQPILFDNKGGASGMIGAEYVKNAPPDGYTFLGMTVAMVAITRYLQPVPFEAEKDFEPVARMSTSWMALAIHPSVPAQNLQEFIDYVRANPGKVNFGSAGLGTITQLMGEMLNLEAGIKMVHVPYKGSAQATGDLVAGQIQAQFDQTVLPQILAGKLRGLAILSDSRWPYKPEIPTLRELGYDKAGAQSWYGILAPAGTPQPIVDKMSKAIGEALKSPDVIEKLDKAGAKATYLDAAAMKKQIAVDNQMFGDVIKRGHITLE